jgi:hypothetical protein
MGVYENPEFFEAKFLLLSRIRTGGNLIRTGREVIRDLFYFEMGSCYVAQSGLELTILLPQPPKCWNYRHVPPCLANERYI